MLGSPRRVFTCAALCFELSLERVGLLPRHGFRLPPHPFLRFLRSLFRRFLGLAFLFEPGTQFFRFTGGFRLRFGQKSGFRLGFFPRLCGGKCLRFGFCTCLEFGLQPPLLLGLRFRLEFSLEPCLLFRLVFHAYRGFRPGARFGVRLGLRLGFEFCLYGSFGPSACQCLSTRLVVRFEFCRRLRRALLRLVFGTPGRRARETRKIEIVVVTAWIGGRRGRGWLWRGSSSLGGCRHEFADESFLCHANQGLQQLCFSFLGKFLFQIADCRLAVHLLQEVAQIAGEETGLASRLHQALCGLGEYGAPIHFFRNVFAMRNRNAHYRRLSVLAMLRRAGTGSKRNQFTSSARGLAGAPGE